MEKFSWKKELNINYLKKKCFNKFVLIFWKNLNFSLQNKSGSIFSIYEK